MGRKKSVAVDYSIKMHSNYIKAKSTNVDVHFKHCVALAAVLSGMQLKRAFEFLKNVIKREECVPFRKHKSGIGHCAQAKQFNWILGRWPKKAAQVFLDLLRNAESNCELRGKDPADFRIGHIQGQMAPIRRRRTYRAHGRINPYQKHMSHVQVVLVDN